MITHPRTTLVEVLSSGSKLPVVINESSGLRPADRANRAQEYRQQIIRLFESVGLKIDLHWCKSHKVAQVLRQISNDDIKALVVGGGDGTVTTAADSLVDSSKLLGILPMGTFNHLARDLNIPLSLEDAIRTIAEGGVQIIDVGDMNGRIFVNNVSIGIYPHAVTKRKVYQKSLGLPKLSAMGYALWGVFWHLPVVELYIDVENARKSIRTPFIFVGNNRYEKDLVALIRRKSLDQGHLHVFYTQHIHSKTLLKIVFQILFGRLQDAPELQSRWIQKLTIDSHKRIKVALDGEVVREKPPLKFQIRPQALHVIAPENSS